MQLVINMCDHLRDRKVSAKRMNYWYFSSMYRCFQ